MVVRPTGAMGDIVGEFGYVRCGRKPEGGCGDGGLGWGVGVWRSLMGGWGGGK